MIWLVPKTAKRPISKMASLYRWSSYISTSFVAGFDANASHDTQFRLVFK